MTDTNLATEDRLPGGRLASAMGTIAASIERSIAKGDAAELRRLSHRDPGGQAFWKICASVLEPNQLLHPGVVAFEDGAARWAAIIGAMGQLAGLHAPRTSLGEALASSGFSELRFIRLLRAHDVALLDAVRPTAAFLASKATACNQAQLAELVLSDGRPHQDAIRRRIARDYYFHLNRKEG